MGGAPTGYLFCADKPDIGFWHPYFSHGGKVMTWNYFEIGPEYKLVEPSAQMGQLGVPPTWSSNNPTLTRGVHYKYVAQD